MDLYLQKAAGLYIEQKIIRKLKASVVDSNNSDTRMNVNAYCHATGYQVDTDPWLSENVVATFVAGTTSTMRLQLQILRGGSGNLGFGFSNSDSRHAEAWEIQV